MLKNLKNKANDARDKVAGDLKEKAKVMDELASLTNDKAKAMAEVQLDQFLDMMEMAADKLSKRGDAISNFRFRADLNVGVAVISIEADINPTPKG